MQLVVNISDDTAIDTLVASGYSVEAARHIVEECLPQMTNNADVVVLDVPLIRQTFLEFGDVDLFKYFGETYDFVFDDAEDDSLYYVYEEQLQQLIERANAYELGNDNFLITI
jgi:hypothetical protein